MQTLFLASVSVIVADPSDSQRLFADALGLTLAGPEGDDYVFTDTLDGTKHFGVWPLSQAATACFGTDEWPTDRPVPQVSIEFDVDDVEAAAHELEARGYELLHGPRTEPWGQGIARLQTSDGAIVGVSRTPWMRDDTAGGAEST
jgi:catechol 2,3-dioxygenase-like lactoylglutathione lyase family enzyme